MALKANICGSYQPKIRSTLRLTNKVGVLLIYLPQASKGHQILRTNLSTNSDAYMKSMETGSNENLFHVM